MNIKIALRITIVLLNGGMQSVEASSSPHSERTSNLELTWKETCDAGSPVFFSVAISKTGKVVYEGHYGVRTVGSKMLSTSRSSAERLFEEVRQALEQKKRSSEEVHPVGTCVEVKLSPDQIGTSLFYEDDAARAISEAVFKRVNFASVVCPARQDLLFSGFACERPIFSFAYREHSVCDRPQHVTVYRDFGFHYYLDGSRDNDQYGSIRKKQLDVLRTEMQGEHEEETAGAGMTWQVLRGDIARQYWETMVRELKLHVVPAKSAPCDEQGGPFPLGERGLRDSQ